jgi:hypothetical protein
MQKKCIIIQNFYITNYENIQKYIWNVNIGTYEIKYYKDLNICECLFISDFVCESLDVENKTIEQCKEIVLNDFLERMTGILIKVENE